MTKTRLVEALLLVVFLLSLLIVLALDLSILLRPFSYLIMTFVTFLVPIVGGLIFIALANDLPNIKLRLGKGILLGSIFAFVYVAFDDFFIVPHCYDSGCIYNLFYEGFAVLWFLAGLILIKLGHSHQGIATTTSQGSMARQSVLWIIIVLLIAIILGWPLLYFGSNWPNVFILHQLGF